MVRLTTRILGWLKELSQWFPGVKIGENNLRILIGFAKRVVQVVLGQDRGAGVDEFWVDSNKGRGITFRSAGEIGD